MSTDKNDPRNGSHLEFYTKEQIMNCARDLIERQVKNPLSLKGIRLPRELQFLGGIETMMYIVKYYDRVVGTVDMETFRITYLM